MSFPTSSSACLLLTALALTLFTTLLLGALSWLCLLTDPHIPLYPIRVSYTLPSSSFPSAFALPIVLEQSSSKLPTPSLKRHLRVHNAHLPGQLILDD